MVFSWLGLQPKSLKQVAGAPECLPYLITGGAAISGTDSSNRPIHIEAGARLALAGSGTFMKHYLCDWLLGYIDDAQCPVSIQVGTHRIEAARDRTVLAAMLGRSPLLYGNTIQESLLYRTQNVRKQDLHYLVERFYGPSLRARTSPQNPLCDVHGKAVATQVLTSREHLEIAQINVLLQKTPLLVLDLSSELMAEALSLGYRPCSELFDGGKTVIAILPPGKDLAWAEQITGSRFSSQMRFE